MEPADHLASIETYGEVLAAAADVADPGVEIATCPGWSMTDLVRHTGEVHRWATHIVATRRPVAWEAPADEVVGRWPADQDLGAWLRDGVDALTAALRSAPVDLECWTFMAAPTAREFWLRRQAHETAIHGADGSLAVGATPSFPVWLAVDGIDELLRSSMSRPRRGPRADPARTLAIAPSDSDDRWVGTIGPSSFAAERGSAAPADCQVSGSASDLYLMLWNRAGDDAIEVEGDRGVLELWGSGAQM